MDISELKAEYMKSMAQINEALADLARIQSELDSLKATIDARSQQTV